VLLFASLTCGVPSVCQSASIPVTDMVTYSMREATFLTHLASTSFGEELAYRSIWLTGRCWGGFRCGFGGVIVFVGARGGVT